MAEFMKTKIGGLKGLDSEKIAKIKGRAVQTGNAISNKAAEIKTRAIETKDDIEDKLTELNRMLESSITEYNDAYTLMNDKGIRLYVERSRAVDTISFAEELVNSIANRPKAFDAEFEEIRSNREQFRNTCDFANHEIQAAREAAAGAGAGLAAGASVAFMAPTAAMWVATTFGTASTGAAISTLSGAAATNAALAWLGGGALTVGGGGMAAGNALLAMAGPVGWTIAGATLLSSILLFAKKRTTLNKQKNDEITAVKENTERVREIDSCIGELLKETCTVRVGLNKMYAQCVSMYGDDYVLFSAEQKQSLGLLVNNTKTLSALLSKTIEK